MFSTKISRQKSSNLSHMVNHQVAAYRFFVKRLYDYCIRTLERQTQYFVFALPMRVLLR